MKRVTAAVLVGISLAALAGVAVFQADAPHQAALRTVPSMGSPFTLTDQNGSFAAFAAIGVLLIFPF